MSKISLIGAGNLGASIAYEIARRDIVEEIVLIDILPDLALGQAADIQHAIVSRSKTHVHSGSYEDLVNSKIIIITAGKPRTAEMKDRLQLAEINIKIMSSIANEIKKYARESIIITLTNPMDVINRYLFAQGFNRFKVIGSGGELDSARFRVVLGELSEGFILGEHGENQVPLFSKLMIDNQKQNFSEEEQEALQEKIRKVALEVIEKKGATIFAPAMHTAEMVQVIIKDEMKRLICSINLQGEYGLQDVSLGVPVILGKNGVERIEEWSLNAEEIEKLHMAGEKLQAFYREVSTTHQEKLFKQ